MPRETRRTNALIVFALLIAAGAFAAYAAILTRWLSAPPKGPPAPAGAAQAAASGRLTRARQEYRARPLEAASHLELSEALWAAGRPVDSFYVSLAARELFGEAEFRKAHSSLVLGAGGPAAAARKRLDGVPDPATAVPVHAEIARQWPDTLEGRASLEALSATASGDENAAGGEAARLARTALEELHQDDPKNAAKLAALGNALLGRGDPAMAEAVAREALSKHPRHAGAAQVLAAAALQRRDWAGARPWLAASWEMNPDDVWSAARLAQVYDGQRGDPEGALPFYLAMHRREPADMAGDAPVEQRIREILDARRASLLKLAAVETLGDRFRLDDASLRAEACLRAAAFKDARWVPDLGDLLDDDVELVRRAADYALFEIAKKDPDAVRARRSDWLAPGGSPWRRARALNLFADLDGMNAFPATLAALRDSDPAVRVFAKLMVLDHYFRDIPDADKANKRYLGEEQDASARALLARHGR